MPSKNTIDDAIKPIPDNVNGTHPQLANCTLNNPPKNISIPYKNI